MPAAINFAALVVSSLATTVAGANLLYLGTLAAVYGAATSDAACIELAHS